MPRVSIAKHGFLWKLNSDVDHESEECKSNLLNWRQRHFYLSLIGEKLCLVYTSEKKDGDMQLGAILHDRHRDTHADYQELDPIEVKLDAAAVQQVCKDLHAYDLAFEAKTRHRRYDKYISHIPHDLHPFMLTWRDQADKENRWMLGANSAKELRHWLKKLCNTALPKLQQFREARCLSRLFFCWVNPLVLVARHKVVGDDDLFDIPERSKAIKLLSSFDRALSRLAALESEAQTSTVYLPKQLKEHTVLVTQDGVKWLVTNEELQSENSYIAYRRSKNLNDRVTHGDKTVEYDTVLTGFDEDDGWVRFHFPVQDSVKRSLLWRAVKRIFWLRLFLTGVLVFLQNAFQLLVPLVMHRYLEWFVDEGAPSWKGWAYVGGATACMMLGTIFCSNHGVMQLYTLGMDLRTMCTALVYRKSMRLRHSARSQISSEQVLNLVSSDCERLPMMILGIHSLWMAPIFIIASTTCLILTVRLATLVVMVVVLLTLPLPFKIGGLQMKVVGAQARQTEKRVKAVTEGLNSMRLLKYFAWEEKYKDIIVGFRTSELSLLRRLARLQGVMMASMMAAPLVIGVSMIIAFSFLDNASFTPANVFTSLTLLNLVRVHLGMLPMGIKGYLDLKASLAHLQTFLNVEELERPVKQVQISSTPTGSSADSTEGGESRCPRCHISVSGANFRWGPKESAASGVTQTRVLPTSAKPKSFSRSEQDDRFSGILGNEARFKNMIDSNQAAPKGFGFHNVDIEVEGGQLVVVVGPTGSGKSSLLSALLHEMPRTEGEVSIEGDIAYCAQEPWIFNGNVKDNILFNRKMNVDWYSEVLSMCALHRDISALPNLDFTEVVSDHTTLSSALRKRIALARACYSSASVYLLDDVLSDFAHEEANWLFEKCIRRLVSQGNIVVLTTACCWLPFLTRANMVCLMDHGRIAKLGTCSDIQAGLSDALFNINSQIRLPPLKVSWEGSLLKPADTPPESPRESGEITARNGSASGSHLNNSLIQSWSLEKEKREGSASIRTWHYYFVTCSGSWAKPLGLAFLFLLSQVFKNGLEWWLARWTDRVIMDDASSDLDYHLIVYGGLGVATVVSVLCRNAFMAEFIVRNARYLHERLLLSVFGAPIGYLEATPLDGIRKCFHQDVSNLDRQLQNSLPTFAVLAVDMLGFCLTIGVFMPIFFAPLLLIGIYYWRLQGRFRPLSGDLNRIASTGRSHILALFSETFSGSTTIRAYGQTQQSLEMCCGCIDASSSGFYTIHNVNRWLQLRLESLDLILFVAVACLSILGRSNGTVSAGIAGLTLFYAQSCSQCSMLNFILRMGNETDAKMVSVGRVHKYISGVELTTGVGLEVPLVENSQPPPDWPKSGHLEFKDVSMRYRPNLPLVLAELSFVVEPGMSIGICGRAGSGKSAIFNVLLRMNDIFLDRCCGGGSVFLDGVSIGAIGLHNLRKAVGIIPRDPVMFAGTVKNNLDLLEEHTEEELWRCLRLASLDTAVKNLREGLAAPVQQGGENFTRSQQQLMSLARSLLRKSVVLCVHEATRSVDSNISSLDVQSALDVQSVIRCSLRTELKGCTALIIPQHLSTIADCDRILCLEQGAEAEYDTPSNLLDRRGRFHSLVHEMGEEEALSLETSITGICPTLTTRASTAGVVSM